MQRMHFIKASSVGRTNLRLMNANAVLKDTPIDNNKASFSRASPRLRSRFPAFSLTVIWWKDKVHNKNHYYS